MRDRQTYGCNACGMQIVAGDGHSCYTPSVAPAPAAPFSSATPPARNEVTEAIVRWLHIIAKEGDRGTRLLALGDAEKYVRSASSPSAEGAEPDVSDEVEKILGEFADVEAMAREILMHRRSPVPAGTPAQEPAWKVITEDAPVQEIVVPVAAPGEPERVTEELTPVDVRAIAEGPPPPLYGFGGDLSDPRDPTLDEVKAIAREVVSVYRNGFDYHLAAEILGDFVLGRWHQRTAALRSSSPLPEDSRREQ